MKTLISTLTALFLVSLLSACSDSGNTTDAAPAKVENAVASTPAPAPQPAVAATPQAAPAADPHAGLVNPHGGGMGMAPSNSGQVLEVLQTSGYSYLHVNSNGRDVWLASSRVDVAPGMTVRWGDYAVMPNFHSKALNRDFREILFVSSVSAAAPPQTDSSGQVLTVDNAGGYSYVQVRTAKGEQWLAAPMTSVAAGDQVNWQSGAVMHNFDSKALNRSFEEIMFVGALNVSR